MSFLRSNEQKQFIPAPAISGMSFAWPTDNRKLFTDPGAYFARTRVNPDYGRPGWTRDCGKRFHRGCDIAPSIKSPDGRMHTVMFSDCATGKEYSSDEPGWIPHDEVFAVTSGTIVEVNLDPTACTLGNYVIMEHTWPDNSGRFYSLYAHLMSVSVSVSDEIKSGVTLGHMGQTSSSPDACKWMAIAPHLHLEFWSGIGESYDPEEMLRRFCGPRVV
jgi:murein DD-endopeptidase MepM/ murein hydrolase activator NlpD